MRFLNKIIFINSGSVKYAEIELDGNVHFIGTQGVGKSTLLRAILFFYNADKIRLGIPREKRRFDDYYFEWQNSYIIYEVIRDNVPYCILAYKQLNRVVYRFFDSEYKQELFIDEQGKACESWDEIRKNFGRKVHFTKLITSYDEYRKIIYGDKKSLSPDFRKYSILESQQYQNIPRTIQNVLLNTKLEAQFIKETIIKSIDEEEIKIDLANYSKNHLRDFEIELNDIQIWFNENKRGQIIVRKQADSVIEHYRSLNFIKQDKHENIVKLAQRIKYISNIKPILLAKYQAEKERLVELDKQIKKLTQLHLTREQDIFSKIKILKTKISEAESKQKEYEKQNIQSIIKRVDEKTNLESKKNNKLKEVDLLTSQYTELKQKYESLIVELKNQNNQFINAKNADKNKLTTTFNNHKDILDKEYKTIIDQIRTNNAEKKETVTNKIETIKEQLTTLRVKVGETKHKTFFKEELDVIIKKEGDLKQSKSDSEKSAFQANNEIQTLKKQWEFEEKELQRQYDIDIASINSKIDELNKLIDETQNKIDSQKDSFYGWLNQNYPEWENSIGKVVDEKTILFNKELQPKLNEKNKSLYGIEINLNAIENTPKTIEDYKTDIDKLNSNIKNCYKQNTARITEFETSHKNLKQKFRNKINPLKEIIAKKEYQISQAELKLDSLTVEFNELTQKADDKKKQALVELEKQINQTTNDKLNAEKELEKIRAGISRQITLKENEKKRRINDIKDALDTDIIRLQTEIQSHQKEIDKRIEEITQKQNDEMSAKGADTKRINELNNLITNITNELDYIEQHQTLVIEFKKDKRELFDNVPIWKSQLSSTEIKKTTLIEKQKEENDKLQEKWNKQNALVSETQQQNSIIEKDLDNYESFQKSDLWDEDTQLIFSNDIKEIQDEQITATDLIKNITNLHYNLIDKFKHLQNGINNFVGNFNEKNVFTFKTKFLSDAEYLSFASELKEFIEEDKITQYEKRVNERFAHIIEQIGKEIGDFVSKEAKIETIIRKINSDFKSKNFVGAIDSMEMRIQSSSNKIVKLLLEIKNFNDENSFTLGEANLFSTNNANKNNRKAIELLKHLVKELEQYKSDVLSLSESFDLQFRIVENDNDLGWDDKISNIGSEGTDILVKAMINILLLNVFKDSASKKFKDFKLHCMMDEIGRLHPSNVKGILKFANDRNILLINGSPTSYNATDYRYTYILTSRKDELNNRKHITRISRLVKTNTQS